LKLKNDRNGQDLCTVVFRLKKGRRGAGRFVYALACRVEQWTDVEVISLQVGDLQYEKEATSQTKPQNKDNSKQGAKQ